MSVGIILSKDVGIAIVGFLESIVKLWSSHVKRIAIRGGLLIGSFHLASCRNSRDRLERHLK